MKKVLLSSVAALAVFAAAAPAFANDNPSINGGANTPGAFDSREAYENQSEFVSARTVEEYLNGHMPDIMAEAAQDPAVVAAKAELDAVEGGSHLYGEKKAAYDERFSEIDLSKTIMVGDGHLDMEFGRNAGTYNVFIGSADELADDCFGNLYDFSIVLAK